MRKKIGVIFMLLGILFVSGAAALLYHNQQEDVTAQEHSHNVLPVIQEQIQNVQENTLQETVPDMPELTPPEFLNPEDLIMTEKDIYGYAYIGYLAIPDLGLELPVMSGWDASRLRVSPCRYTGSVRGEDLVIMAHNYASHFGRLSQLSVGSQVQFADMDGELWEYQVVAIDILSADAVEEMTAGEYDLTLFTCATNRTHRVTVRCDKMESN